MLVIGGMGSVSGSVVGVLFVTLLSEVLRNAERGVNLGFVTLPPVYGASQIVMSVILVLVIIFRPSGLLGGREVSLDWLWPRSRLPGGDEDRSAPWAGSGGK